MNIDETNILHLINQGENASLEFKSKKPRAEKIAREFISFANKDGGTLLLGVADNGKIEGLKDAFNYEEWFSNIARNNVIPPISIKCEQITIQNKKIIAVAIPKGRDKPYQSTDGRYYIRVGSTNRMATQTELLRLFQASGSFHYDQMPVPETGILDLNLAKLDSYFQKYNFGFSSEKEEEQITLLKNTDILSGNGQTTIAGLLIFGSNPSKHLFQNGISFAYFKGTAISEQLIDKKNIDGDLCFQIDTATTLIKTFISSPSTIHGTKREDTKYIFPDKIFRELVTNALVHRNYSIDGSKVRIFLFEDRLEIMSPGRLPNTVTIDKLPFGVSFAVNPVIVKFMENLRYIDQLGRGLPMVCHEAKINNKKIQFEEIGEEFKVTLEL